MIKIDKDYSPPPPNNKKSTVKCDYCGKLIKVPTFGFGGFIDGKNYGPFHAHPECHQVFLDNTVK